MSKEDEGEGSSNILPQMLSGAMAGLVSRVISAPLDVLKIRFQLQDANNPKYSSLNHAIRRIIHEEGILGLWKGNIPAVYLWVSYSAFQFMVYGELKRYGNAMVTSFGISESNTPAHAAVNFTSGAASGIIATTITYPFDIMRTQFAIQGDKVVHPSMLQYIQRTYTRKQFPGFFHGLPAAVVGIVPFMGLNFTIYEFLKSKGQAYYHLSLLSSSAQKEEEADLEERGAELSPYASSSTRRTSTSSTNSSTCTSTGTCTDASSLMLISGIAGGVAGGVSKLIVYPLDTMKKRMQAQALASTFQEPFASRNIISKSSSSSSSSSSSNDTLSSQQQQQQQQQQQKGVGKAVVGGNKAGVGGVVEDHSTLRRCFRTILRNEGAMSFYKGIAPTVAKSVVSTAVTFYVYEGCFIALKSLLSPQSRK